MSNKKQTPEEAAHEYFKRGQLGFEKASDTEEAFLKGAKWQQERMYSEKDMRLAFEMGGNFQVTGMDYIDDVLEKLNKNKK